MPTSRICNDDDCEKRACYNFKGLKPLYCSNHKKENMIDTSKPVCKITNCMLRGLFKDLNIKGAYFCSAHKSENSSNTNHKKCIFVSDENINCGKRATYGFASDKKYLYCNEHKVENTVHIDNLRKLKK